MRREEKREGVSGRHWSTLVSIRHDMVHNDRSCQRINNLARQR